MQIRPADASDAPEIVRLAGLMYASMGHDAGDPEWIEAAERAVRSRLGRDMVAFVADRPSGSGGLVASGAATIAVRLPAPNNPAARVGYIQWIATEPDFQRRGLGRAVMEALLAWLDAQAVPVIELHATPAGESLYRSLGFDDRSGGKALRRRRPTP